jgi:raffinose/stachyose/melibiose transport system permease protein
MKRAKRINLFFFLVASVLAVLYAFPFLIVLLNSVKDKRSVRNDPLGLPTEWQWSNFTEAIRKMDYWQALGNSLLVTIIAVIAIVLTSSMLAYYEVLDHHVSGARCIDDCALPGAHDSIRGIIRGEWAQLS